MTEKRHTYTVTMKWTGNTGRGTADYRSYERAHEYGAPGKPVIPGSSDPSFRGDSTRYNPEELLVMSISSCHMLWYLHLSAVARIVVVEYEDNPVGTMVESADGSGRFIEVAIKPTVTLAAGSDAGKAESLHERAHHMCFIANSVNFPIRVEPDTVVQGAS
jgi:organic hydroperoxide reductase OsmC/OhrA